MKHVLLATTALAMSASVAAADMALKMSGTAGAGVITAKTAPSDSAKYQNTNGNYVAYSGVDINLSASVDLDDGTVITFSDDIGGGGLLDTGDDEIDDQGNDIGHPAVTVATSSGLTVVLDGNGIDDVFDDSKTGDLSLAMSLGGLTAKTVMDLDENGSSSYSLSYGMGDLSVGYKGTDSNDANVAANIITASYSTGPFSMSVGMDSTDGTAGSDKGFASLTYAADSMSITYKAQEDNATGKDIGKDYTISGSFSAMGMKISGESNEAENWEVDVTYDLGGATVQVGVNDAETTYAGVKFTF
jgi:hypothetical protein